MLKKNFQRISFTSWRGRLETRCWRIDGLGTVRAGLGTVRARRGTVRARLGTVRARLGTVRARLGIVRARQSTVRARLGTVRARLAQVVDPSQSCVNMKILEKVNNISQKA